MPIRGIILILVIGALFSFLYRNEIFDWLSSLGLTDEDNTNKSEEDK